MTLRTENAPLGWPARIGLSAVSFCALLVFAAALAMQSCTERGAANHRQRARAAAAAQPLSVPSDSVDRRNDGRLVHVTGRLGLSEPVHDAQLGFGVDALVLERKVEVYAWENGLTPEASPTPDTRWRRRHRWSSPTPRPSAPSWRELKADFRDPDPGSGTRPNSFRFVATTAQLRLGAFGFHDVELPQDVTFPLQDLPASAAMLEGLPEPLRARARIFGPMICVGTPTAPAVGDLRISYRVAPLQDVSVIAGQDPRGLGPYSLSDGVRVFVMRRGRRDASDVLRAEESEVSTVVNHMFSVPLFAIAVFLSYWPLRALGRVVAIGRPAEAGWFVFLVLGTVATVLGGVAYMRWTHGAAGVGWPAAMSVAAAALLVHRGTRRRERRLAAPENQAVWYYVDDAGATAGPTSLSSLRRAMREGASLDTLVAGPSMPDWVPAAQVPALAAAAPPAPPQPDEVSDFFKWYFLWPIALLDELVKGARPTDARGALTRGQYFDATVLALLAAIFLTSAGIALGAAEPPGPGTSHIVVAGVIALLGGIVLPTIFMLRATVGRLRAVGESVRLSLLMLVPLANVVLWFHLLKPDDPATEAKATGFTPVIPPSDRISRRR